jgi:hypothetical protein
MKREARRMTRRIRTMRKMFLLFMRFLTHPPSPLPKWEGRAEMTKIKICEICAICGSSFSLSLYNTTNGDRASFRAP